MISGYITKASVLFQVLTGLSLLFAADAILPRIVGSYPTQGYWLGQLLGAALLGLANFNYFSRSSLLGGIYGRAVVASNTTFYFISAMVLLRHVGDALQSPLLAIVGVVIVLFAGLYGWLLYRGPFERDLALHNTA